jgi:hypothetical protein
MTGDRSVYKPNKYVMGGGLVVLAIVFFGLTLPLIVAGTPVETGQLVGLGGFWLFGIILTVAPLGFRLEIEEHIVRSYFLNVCLKELRQEDVVSVNYGNLFPVNLGGKGLIIYARVKGKNVRLTMGENLYSKQAIEHAKRALEPRR